MRILSIIAQKPYATGSGVYLTELLREFENMGHEQAMVCGIAGDENFEHYERSFPKIRMFPVRFNTDTLPFNLPGMSDVMPYPSTRYRDLSQEQAQDFEKAFVSTITKAVETFQPDLILCHHLYFLTSLVVENFSADKVGAICHGTCLRQLASNSFERERIRSAIAKIPHIFALQSEQKKDIESVFGIEAGKISVVGNGYNPKIFYKRASETIGEDGSAAWQNDNGGKNDLFPISEQENLFEKASDRMIRLAFAGKISFSKGLLSLFEAIDKIRDKKIQLFLAGGAGDVKEFDQIRNRAEQSVHQVIFLGQRSQEDLAKLYSRCDLFVFPSYYEGLGLAIIEAMACGLPVVVSDTEGLQEWITSKTQNAPITFIPLPEMESIDKPMANDLPAYEERLAKAICAQIEAIENNHFQKCEVCMDQFSWQSVAENILSF